MKHFLTTACSLLPLLTPSAGAQGNEAKAVLYSRVEGERVAAAVVIRINPGWYLYHTELGHPDAIGTPLSIDFGGEGITWGELVMPDPKVKQVKGGGGLPDHTVNTHFGRITAYALGKLAPGAEGADVTATLNGLTCSDAAGICIPYGETVKSKGDGREKYWADWPEALGKLPPVAARAAPAPAEEPTGAPTEVPTEQPNSQSPPPVELPLSRNLGPDLGVGGGSDEKVAGVLYLRFDESTDAARAVIELEVAEGFHIYHGPTKADLGHPRAIGNPTEVEIEGGGAEWEAALYPAPERLDQGIDDIWINSHHGTLRLRVEGWSYEEPDPEDVLVTVAGQVCDDVGCRDFELELTGAGEGPDEAFAAFETVSAVDPPYGADGGTEKSSLGWFLLQAVLWGIITLLMPCTYPMIPITISFFTKQAIARDGKVLPLALTYGAGIVLIFILIGLVFAPVIIPFATHPVTNIVIGGLFLFFAFVLFGWVNLQPPKALMRVAGKASQRGGFAGVFIMGATLVVTSFTCTAPFVGTLLGSAAVGGSVGQDYLRVILGMGVFGLTMATPFVFLSLIPGKLQQMPQAGEWMNTLKVFLGFLELAASLKFISNADIVWKWGVLSREVFLLAWIAIFVGALAYVLQRALAPLRGGGKVSRRLVWGTGAMLALILYMAWGLPGRRMDRIFTAILPNYSHDPLIVFFGGEPWVDRHVIVKDDYDEALRLAKEQEKLLLVNFTGFT